MMKRLRSDPVLSDDHSRRGALLRGGAILLGLAAAPDLVRARKGAKKGKRKRQCKNANQPNRVPTCDEHCFPQFSLCFERTVGPPLCANGAFTDGSVPCSTDQECLGDPSKPYCLVSGTERDSGAASRFATCEPYGEGCCIYAGIFP